MVLEKVGIIKTILLLNLGTNVEKFTVESGHSCEIFYDLVKFEETLDMYNKMANIHCRV